MARNLNIEKIIIKVDGVTKLGKLSSTFAKLNKNIEIILVCGAGGQAALSGKTLIEMGYSNVKNVGGIGDWEKNNGPMDK